MKKVFKLCAIALLVAVCMTFTFVLATASSPVELTWDGDGKDVIIAEEAIIKVSSTASGTLNIPDDILVTLKFAYNGDFNGVINVGSKGVTFDIVSGYTVTATKNITMTDTLNGLMKDGGGTLILAGTVNIKSNGSYGLDVYDGSLLIKGAATLEGNEGSGVSTWSDAVIRIDSGSTVTINGRISGNLTIDSGTIVINGNINLNERRATINNGTVTVNGGIFSSESGNITFNNGTVKINGNIDLEEGTVTINGGRVEVTAKEEGDVAIRAKSIHINGGSGIFRSEKEDNAVIATSLATLSVGTDSSAVTVWKPGTTTLAEIGKDATNMFFVEAGTNTKLDAVEFATFTVTVNGAPQGTFIVGTPVSLTAGAAPEGQRFAGWTIPEGITLTSGTASTTTIGFLMPFGNVTITATYEPIPEPPANTTPTSPEMGDVGTGVLLAFLALGTGGATFAGFKAIYSKRKK
jgi:lipopolysaccharide export system protein LptA